MGCWLGFGDCPKWSFLFHDELRVWNDELAVRGAVRWGEGGGAGLPDYAVVIAVIASASLESAEFLVELDCGNGA